MGFFKNKYNNLEPVVAINCCAKAEQQCYLCKKRRCNVHTRFCRRCNVKYCKQCIPCNERHILSCEQIQTNNLLREILSRIPEQE